MSGRCDRKHEDIGTAVNDREKKDKREQQVLWSIGWDVAGNLRTAVKLVDTLVMSHKTRTQILTLKLETRESGSFWSTEMTLTTVVV